jgi:Tfp pilus assembly protein PilF
LSKKPSSKYVTLEKTKVEEISSFLFELGNQFLKVENAEGAFDSFRYSVELNDKNYAAVYNLGCVYTLKGNHEGAYRMFREAARMNEKRSFMAKICQSEAARRLGNLDEAMRLLRECEREDPESVHVLTDLSLILYDQGNLAQALELTNRALEKTPNDPHLLLNKTLVNMTYGHWRENWSLYEFCLSYRKSNARMKNLRMADAWSGQEVERGSLLVISDQGMGDCVQFARYLKEAKALGKFARLAYLVQPDLVELMRGVDGVDEVFGFGDKTKYDYDTFSSLLGVMRVLQVGPEDCWRPPHIATDARLDLVWKARLGAMWDGKSKRVGIVWGGDPKHGNDQNRSLPLSQFLKFTGVPGIQWYSFQVGLPVKQLHALGQGCGIVDLGGEFRTFSDTASALGEMDLLISCDTSTPHLAAGMGKPVWWLIPRPGEWRWLNDVTDNLWYYNSRLFRQPVPKDWDSAVASVRSALVEWVREKE